MSYSYQIDPFDILGVPPGASLESIRDAYREKAKKHHPDHGGDAWAFRIVSWAYKTLGTARVVGRASEEMARTSAPPPPPPAGPRPRGPRPEAEPGDGRVRPGHRDKGADPAQVVEVELLQIRFEVADPMQLLLGSPEDRNLSCSLNVTWPPREQPAPAPGDVPAAAEALRRIAEAFDLAATKTRPVSARSGVEGGRFVGWLSYPNVARAEAAIQALQDALHARGLFVTQWIRDIFVPRDWR